MRDAMPNIDFVAARIGSEAHSLRNWARQARVAESPPAERLWVRLARGTKRAPARVARKLLTNLSNGDLAALRVGRFRRSGEVHQWMYDRFSLARALRAVGLEQVVERSAVESYADRWSEHHLDTEPDGSVYKPDSLFMEGLKP
jgi:hypothetical protein